LKITEKTAAHRLKARTFGVVAVSVCTALIILTPSIAQASQSPTSSKARNNLTAFVSLYDGFLNPCFKEFNTAVREEGKGDFFNAEIASQSVPEQCSLATGLLRNTPAPMKAYPSLIQIDSLTASWISDADLLAAGMNDIMTNKKTSASQNANFNKAFRAIGPAGVRILNSIRAAIIDSKSNSIGKLPTIPSERELLKESA
jgi:hypothetical protein